MAAREEDDLDVGEPPAIDPYETLGIEPSASSDQVKSAYRKAALKNHPGKHGWLSGAHRDLPLTPMALPR